MPSLHHPTLEPSRTYCIVGAGAAGLGAATILAREGIPFEVLERSSYVGGHWRTDYDALHLITSRDSSGFPGRPMPSEYATFPHRDEVHAYLEDVASIAGLRRHIRFDTEVTGLARHADGRWEVRCADGTVRTYAGVLLASGHLWNPRLPAEADDYTGRSLHSHDYRNTGDIGGDCVLVVGAGNSGCDIAVDAAQARIPTTISMRHGQAFLPKTVFGTARAELTRINSLPPKLRDLAIRALTKVVVGSPERYRGLPEPQTRSFDDQPPVVNDLLLYWIQHGRITVRPGIEHVRGTEVTFTDGHRRNFDTILWCTGYHVTMPELAGHLDWSGGLPGTRAGMILPEGDDTDLEGLYLIGFTSPRGPQFPVYARQAETVCRMIRLHEAGIPARTKLRGRFPLLHQIDIVRSTWEKEMDRVERALRSLESRRETPTVPQHPGVAPRAEVTQHDRERAVAGGAAG